MGLIKKLWLWLVGMVDCCYNGFMLRYKRVRCEETPTIYGRLRIYGGGPIQMGKGVVINSCESANPIGGDTKTIFSLAHGGALQIGNNVGMSNTTIVCHDQVVIEDDVRIGGSTKIYDTNFHSLDVEERLGRKPETVKTAPVRIKKGAFIGAHCIILKGVTIGENSIVGAGAVVTKDVPDGEIWGGNPAGFLRKV